MPVYTISRFTRAICLRLLQCPIIPPKSGRRGVTNPRPTTPPLMRFRKRRFSCWYLAARLAGYQDAPRFCHTFGHSPILWQISSFEQLLSTRPIPGMLYYQQPPDPSLCRLSPTSLVLWSRLTSVGSAMPCSMGYILRCVPHRSPRIRYNSLHSM